MLRGFYQIELQLFKWHACGKVTPPANLGLRIHSGDRLCVKTC